MLPELGLPVATATGMTSQILAPIGAQLQGEGFPLAAVEHTRGGMHTCEPENALHFQDSCSGYSNIAYLISISDKEIF